MFPPTRIAVQDKKPSKKQKEGDRLGSVVPVSVSPAMLQNASLHPIVTKAHPNLHGRLKALLPIYVLIGAMVA